MSLLSNFLSSHRFNSVTADSRQVMPGSLFLAYPGIKSDGRDFIAQAIKAGASGVLWEAKDFYWQSDWQVNQLAVPDLKQQVGFIAADYYQQPSNMLNMIGVTGTNGKTSVTQWIGQCLTILGKKTAVLGTIGNGFIDGQSTILAEAANTTPDAILLQAMLADFVAHQADTVVMEVSSHGLDQGRVNGVAFDIAILTNLSRDHLDYHQTMEAYAVAKQKLFEWPSLKVAILNLDDAFGRAVANMLKSQNINFMSYGLESGQVMASDLALHDTGLSMRVKTPQGEALLTAPVLGRFNAYNILAVLTTLLALDVSLRIAVKTIAQIKPVQGRMQQFGGGVLPLVVIDYAHTPDALSNVLSTLREQTQKKLICVFGCGGDRDAGKRPLMGNIASQLADVILLTSDNPRSENPGAIISEIATGIHPNAGCLIEPDRAVAIQRAIQSASLGDIVLVAGKGHENYQEIAGVKFPFSDAAIALDALSQYSTSQRGLSL